MILCLAAVLLLTSACGAGTGKPAAQSETPAAAEKNGDVVVLFTGDVHCGIDDGFGYTGVEQIRESYEKQGYTTVLVDCGDSLQGDTIGTLTKGAAITEIMNAMDYDVAVPGNHDFDFGADNFIDLAGKAEFPYICCNLFKNGEPLFDSYYIMDAAGIKIAFVGITSPETITVSTPAFFQDENGEFIYDFMPGDSVQGLYDAVQNAVDSARAEGADYVYVLGHVGMKSTSIITYADIVANTSGIDVFLDGHSHDTDQVVLKNKNGEDVVRSATGTKLNHIGYSIITAENGIENTALLNWSNSASARELFCIENNISKLVEDKLGSLDNQLKEVIAHTSFTLTVNDPTEKDDAGDPIRMVRRAETNLGNFCADAFLNQLDADIAIVNGGGIRTDIEKGDITYEDILTVFPFNNKACVIEATGQQILDALEWGAQEEPDEFGAFMQVAGLSYEVDVSVPSGCVRDKNGMQAAIQGERRVRNVTVGGEPIDPDKLYTVAGVEYVLLNNGDGLKAFDGATVVKDDVMIDSQLLIDYITDDLGGEIGAEYSDPLGQGRITVTGSTE